MNRAYTMYDSKQMYALTCFHTKQMYVLYIPGAVKALQLKLLCQKSGAQNEGCILFPLCLQVTSDVQHILTVQPGYLLWDKRQPLQAVVRICRIVLAIWQQDNKLHMLMFLTFSLQTKDTRRRYSQLPIDWRKAKLLIGSETEKQCKKATWH